MRALLFTALGFFGMGAGLIAFCPVQKLVSTRLGVAISADEPVAVTMATSRSLGLSAQDRVIGAPPLNKLQQVEATVSDSSTLVLDEPLKYCTTHLWWTETPDPSAVFTLHFADADETYTVMRAGSIGTYFVTHDLGHEVSESLAMYRLSVGELRKVSGEWPQLWLLDLKVERQSQPQRKGTATA